MKKYRVFKLLHNNFDGYLKTIDKKFISWVYYLNATNDNIDHLTLKQAQKIVFKLNQDAKKTFSYYYRYGYEELP